MRYASVISTLCILLLLTVLIGAVRYAAIARELEWLSAEATQFARAQVGMLMSAGMFLAPGDTLYVAFTDGTWRPVACSRPLPIPDAFSRFGNAYPVLSSGDTMGIYVPGWGFAPCLDGFRSESR